MLIESVPIFASLVSVLSRAGLNVVDRRQSDKGKVNPIANGYWNNLLPIILVAPIVIVSPAQNHFLGDLFSCEILLFSILTQLVAYSFGYAFKYLRVTDIAVLSKSADLTVPLVFACLGIYFVPLTLFALLPAILITFFMSAGVEAVKKSYVSAITLVGMLTAQGICSYFLGLTTSPERNFWGLISLSFAVLVWRFLFSVITLIHNQGISSLYARPKCSIFSDIFYLRGALTVLTQVSLVIAISENQFVLIWPILNATGFVGAIFSWLFLGEKLFWRDYLFIAFSFLITLIVFDTLRHDKNQFN